MMTPSELRKRLRGVIGFPVTPFKPDLSLDLEGLRRNVRFMTKHPFAAIVAAGGTGELYSLTPDEHAQVVTACVEESNGVPVIAGAGFGRELGVQLAKQGLKSGAAGILAFPPYYPSADDEGLLEYYRAIGEATPLGLFVYSRDSVNPSAAQVERIAAKVPTLIAWKDGQGDLRRLEQIMARLGDRLYWIGGVGEDLLPGYYALGIRTYTSSVSNVAPGLSIRLHDLAAAGDTPALGPLMKDYVLPLYEFRARRRGYEVTVMKDFMTLIGLAGGVVRPPLPSLRPEELAELKSMVARWKPVL
jgi:5-dehydro-4-deoxyglucarate dehydratase